MPLQITIDGHHVVGQQNHIESPAPSGSFAVVFQDDGVTGYFYALDSKAEGNRVLDGVHVYDVAAIPENEKVAHLHFGWSEDSRKAALIVNGVPHAVFDFDAKRGYCQSGFPEPNPEGAWPQESHAWSDDTAKLFA